MRVGRRLIYDKVSGRIIIDIGEIEGDVLPREPLGELAYIDLEYGQHRDEFLRANKYHINPETKEVIFDELVEPIITPEEKIVELENQLLIAEGVI